MFIFILCRPHHIHWLFDWEVTYSILKGKMCIDLYNYYYFYTYLKEVCGTPNNQEATPMSTKHMACWTLWLYNTKTTRSLKLNCGLRCCCWPCRMLQSKCVKLYQPAAGFIRSSFWTLHIIRAVRLHLYFSVLKAHKAQPGIKVLMSQQLELMNWHFAFTSLYELLKHQRCGQQFRGRETGYLVWTSGFWCNCLSNITTYITAGR